MKIALILKGVDPAARRAALALQEHKVAYSAVEEVEAASLKDAELVVVVGGDGDVLRTLHKAGSVSVPVLGVNEADGTGFLTEVGLSDFKDALGRIAKGEYWTEEAQRLSIAVDAKELPPALNEVAVFSSRSATLFEYVLKVDEEPVWRDYGDGVIVSTPTGSTAYAMSAGGPMILHNTGVFAVVPVNSLDVTRRPLIVPDTSRIRISEITSHHACEVIVDGILRAKVKNFVDISRSPTPAKLVRLAKASKAMDKIAKKIHFAEELLKMPASAKLILKTLEYEGPLTQKALIEKTMLPERTARLALNLLVGRGLVKRQALLRDARHKLYHIA